MVEIGGRVAALAGRQHGLVTFAQLIRLGLSRSAIRHWASVGRLHRVHIGVYAVGHRALGGKGVLLAAVMAGGASAVLSHVHAVHLWRLLPPWGEPPGVPVHVSVPPGCGRGRRPGVIIHRARLPSGEVAREAAIPVTSPARTLLDLAATVSPRELERLVDQAITDRRVTVATLRAAAERIPRRPGARGLRRLLETADRFDSLTRSELEEEFVRVVRAGGIRAPSGNALIGGMRIDAVWRDERVAVELDGYRWHRTRYRQESDRDREARLRRLGWFPVRYSARQVFDEPLLVIADLAAILAVRGS